MLLYGLVVLIFGAPSVRGQQAGGAGQPATAQAGVASGKLPHYDVVTIRPNNQGPGSVSIDSDINYFKGTNMSLQNLLQEGYNLQPDEISGGPKWVDSARFDIRAKIVETPPDELKGLRRDDHRRMIRELLADRFHLQVHTEIKTLPVYELVVARGGAKLPEIAPEHQNDAFNGISSGSTSIHNGNLNAHFVSMASFAETMSGQVHRPVLDKTGMAGNYNFQLTWTRDDVPAVDDAAAPPLFTALEEQLGLKLVPTRGPVKTLVIDRADIPSADEN